MKKLKVYIASPYNNGWAGDNVRRQLNAMKILMDYGFDPFVPLLAHFAEISHHRPESDWIDWDLAWLEACDILVRIRPVDSNGEEIISTGSDIEVEKAKELVLPVYNFRNLEELESWANEVDKEYIWDICVVKKYAKENN